MFDVIIYIKIKKKHSIPSSEGSPRIEKVNSLIRTFTLPITRLSTVLFIILDLSSSLSRVWNKVY